MKISRRIFITCCSITLFLKVTAITFCTLYATEKIKLNKEQTKLQVQVDKKEDEIQKLNQKLTESQESKNNIAEQKIQELTEKLQTEKENQELKSKLNVNKKNVDVEKNFKRNLLYLNVTIIV